MTTSRSDEQATYLAQQERLLAYFRLLRSVRPFLPDPMGPFGSPEARALAADIDAELARE